MEDECESITQAKSMTVKKKIDVLSAMAKFQAKKELEREEFNKTSPLPSPVVEKPLDLNPPSIQPLLSMKEASVGITEFVDKGPGFSAILKQRYSDFHVHEISMDGRTVWLTDQSVPALPEELECPSIAEQSSSLLTQEDWNNIEDMMTSEEKKTVELDVTDKTKEERIAIHQALRAKYKAMIASNSVPEDGKTIMKIFKHVADKRQNIRWNGPPFLEFVLYKENLSTMEAIAVIARKTHYKSQQFQTAGTKDKRAVTSQLVSVKQGDPKKLLGCMKSDSTILVGNFVFANKPLQLGHLKGNRFSIVLRNVIGEESHVISKLKSLKENGFINYYGSQRFGTRHVPTHHIGRQLLMGKWKEAIDLILEPPEIEAGKFQRDFDLTLARVEWKKTGNAHRAFSKIRRSLQTIEAQLLLSLKKYGNDLVGALNTIPRNMRLTYIHAFQSFMWNTIVSKRVAHFGLKPIVGDLVYAPGQEEAPETEQGEMVDNEAATSEEAEPNAAGSNQRAQRNQRKVIFIDNDNIGEYTIHDVVLPLPGFDILYPKNEVATWYRELLASEGLTESSFKQSVKSYNLGGAYRLIMSKPTDVEWKFVRYDDPTLSLIPSDRDRLKNLEPPLPAEDGAYVGLVLEFSLPPSGYATMALREITKMDMSASAQTTLNEAGGTLNKRPPPQTPHAQKDPVDSKRIKKEEDSVDTST